MLKIVFLLGTLHLKSLAVGNLNRLPIPVALAFRTRQTTWSCPATILTGSLRPKKPPSSTHAGKSRPSRISFTENVHRGGRQPSNPPSCGGTPKHHFVGRSPPSPPRQEPPPTTPRQEPPPVLPTQEPRGSTLTATPHSTTSTPLHRRLLLALPQGRALNQAPPPNTASPTSPMTSLAKAM